MILGDIPYGFIVKYGADLISICIGTQLRYNGIADAMHHLFEKHLRYHLQ
jgi:hypothetical protein